MSSSLKKIASLRILLAEMEAEIGLGEIGDLEKSVLVSFADLEAGNQMISTTNILRHKLNRQYSRPSLFRALKKLEGLGKISKIGGKRGYYELASDSAAL